MDWYWKASIWVLSIVVPIIVGVGILLRGACRTIEKHEQEENQEEWRIMGLSTVSADIATVKKRLIMKAKVKGIHENFGVQEVRRLKDRHNYLVLVSGGRRQRRAASDIDALEDWACSYDGTEA